MATFNPTWKDSTTYRELELQWDINPKTGMLTKSEAAMDKYMNKLIIFYSVYPAKDYLRSTN